MVHKYMIDKPKNSLIIFLYRISNTLILNCLRSIPSKIADRCWRVYRNEEEKRGKQKTTVWNIIQAIHQPVKLDNRYSISKYQK